MNAGEISTLLTFIESLYGKNVSPTQSKTTIEAWLMVLADLDYREVQFAVVALSSENRNFPPNPGQIRSKLATAKTNTIPADEAFGLIREAVRKFGLYQEDEARKYLGPEIWLMVSRYTWSYFCEMQRDNITTYAAQFRRAWEGESERKLAQVQIPEAVRLGLEAMGPKDLPPCLRNENDKAAKGISADSAAI